MALPGHTAVAALYRSDITYRGGNRTGVGIDAVVAHQADDCFAKCSSKFGLESTGCAFGLIGAGTEFPWVGLIGWAICEIVASWDYDDCVSACPQPAGGAGNQGTGNCRPGQRCCERNTAGACTLCIPARASCP